MSCPTCHGMGFYYAGALDLENADEIEPYHYIIPVIEKKFRCDCAGKEHSIRPFYVDERDRL